MNSRLKREAITKIFKRTFHTLKKTSLLHYYVDHWLMLLGNKSNRSLLYTPCGKSEGLLNVKSDGTYSYRWTSRG
jgi:hypothetical protein